MNRITKLFQHSKAYAAYITAGDGGIKHSLKSMLALEQGGVNLFEIGVPFSDPVADGPVIQAASARALKNNIVLNDVLDLAREFRKHSNKPIVLFSYYNPIFQVMHNDFFKRAKIAGVDGCLVVDLPLEEADDYRYFCQQVNIAPIFIISPSTSIKRIQKINEAAGGMLYYACRKGITGEKNNLPNNFVENVERIKQNISLPIIAGFGISSRGMACDVVRHADGFVIGSKFVSAIAENTVPSKLTELAKRLNPYQ